MKLSDLDQRNGAAVTRGLQWLETLLRSRAVQWSPGQRDAAAADLQAARAIMGRDLLSLAQDAHTPRAPLPVLTLDRAERGTIHRRQ